LFSALFSNISLALWLFLSSIGYRAWSLPRLVSRPIPWPPDWPDDLNSRCPPLVFYAAPPICCTLFTFGFAPSQRRRFVAFGYRESFITAKHNLWLRIYIQMVFGGWTPVALLS